jgi:GT2 family glycosyltransferase
MPQERADDARAADLFGVLVTFRRPADLEDHLARLRRQSRRFAHLVVVDNAAEQQAERLVRGHVQAGGGPVTYLASPDNSGAAGGIAQGLRAVLPLMSDQDWVVLLDDDNPPRSDETMEQLFAFALREASDPRVAAVGLTGARFDWRRGRLSRLADGDLHGTIDVDYVGGNQFPMLRAGAVRDVGVYRGELFWGLDDLDFGLRLRSRGYRVLVDGELVRWARREHGRLGLDRAPASALMTRSGWRQYYTLRNLIDILRRHDRSVLAARVACTRGFGKGVVHSVRHPRQARSTLDMTWRAVREGWSGDLGRTVEPDSTTTSSP